MCGRECSRAKLHKVNRHGRALRPPPEPNDATETEPGMPHWLPRMNVECHHRSHRPWILRFEHPNSLSGNLIKKLTPCLAFLNATLRAGHGAAEQ